MPELAFFAGQDLEERLVRGALSSGLRLIPDLNFDSDRFVEADSYQAYKAFRERTRHFFITSPGYAESPLELRPIVKDGKVVYYIFPLVGGPIIELLLPVRFLEGQSPAMRCGVLSHSRKYTSSRLKRDLPVPKELVAAYKRLISMLTGRSERLTGKKGTYLLDEALKPSVKEISLATDMVLLG